jgi:hypothetical protein
MKERNDEFNKQFKNLKCRTCKHLGYWDWYLCGMGNHSDKDNFLKSTPLPESKDYERRDVDWFWGLKPEDFDKFYPE